MNVLLPLLSTIVSLVFAGALLAQYVRRRKPYQVVWSIGFIWYGASTFAEVLWGLRVRDELIYRLWYLIGVYFVASYLGMATIYLLAQRRVAHVTMALLALGSLIAAYLLFTAPVNLAALQGGRLAGDALPNYVRLLTPLFNTFGAAALVLGAAYSAWVFWRQRIFPARVLSNVLIAVGGLFPSTGGILLRLGVPDLFYLFEFFGVALIFAGFLANYEVIASRFAWKAKMAA